MLSINRIVMAGNLVRDPEIRHFGNNVAIAMFTLAVDKSIKTKSGEYKKQVGFFKVVTWNQVAHQCMKFLKKGKQVFVEGELSNRSYDDQNGKKQYMTQIVAKQVSFFTNPKGSNDSEDTEENFNLL
ncbi:MAG: single-stranded DNA-binding protein [Candidatus Riflebacteria bacterium]|jgi:single-strand DNA-binding protein|nr:single-stranded DNA-binding protein [Candidatus Riflebacteria bacterium]